MGSQAIGAPTSDDDRRASFGKAFGGAKKKSPGAGSAEARTHYTERTTSPKRTLLDIVRMAGSYGSSVTIRCQLV
jgi:hypothetical protein